MAIIKDKLLLEIEQDITTIENSLWKRWIWYIILYFITYHSTFTFFLSSSSVDYTPIIYQSKNQTLYPLSNPIEFQTTTPVVLNNLKYT